MSLRTFDFAAMLVQLMGEGTEARALAEKTGSENMTAQMLRHYMDGGVPNFPRGYAIVLLWQEVTGLPLEQAPMIDWSPPIRVDSNAPDYPKCPTCGQSIRSAERADKFVQLQVHYSEHGDPEAKPPSWLSPQIQETISLGRVVRTSDAEPSDTLFSAAQ